MSVCQHDCSCGYSRFGKPVGTDKKSQEEYAVKIMEVAPAGQDVGGNDNSWADVIAEVSILCRLDHSNIICLREFFIQSNKVYLVTNLVKGTCLRCDQQALPGGDRMRRVAPTLSRAYINTVLLKHFHSMAAFGACQAPPNSSWE